MFSKTLSTGLVVRVGSRDQELPHDQEMAIHYSKKIKNRAPPDFITVAYRPQAIVHAMAPLVEGISPKKTRNAHDDPATKT
jgi:hypothetical protein